MQRESTGIDWQAIKDRIARIGEMIEQGGDHIDREVVLARRAERYRRVEQQVVTDRVELVVFRRGGVRYGVRLDTLEEIRSARRISPLPGVSPVIRGVINVRGQIVAMHDLAAFRGATEPLPEQPWAVIGHGESSLIALVADQVEGVQRPENDAIRPIPLSMGDKESCFSGVLDDGTVVLDFAGLAGSAGFFLA